MLQDHVVLVFQHIHLLSHAPVQISANAQVQDQREEEREPGGILPPVPPIVTLRVHARYLVAGLAG